MAEQFARGSDAAPEEGAGASASVQIFERRYQNSALAPLEHNLFVSTLGDSAFRQQESIFIVFNICTLLALAAILLGFRPWMADADFTLTVALFLARALEQAGELIYFRWRKQPFTASQVRICAHASIWSNVVFAGLVSLVADTDEAHYMVLLLLPVVAACFRYTLPGLLLVIVVSSLLEFLELVIYYLRFPPMEAEHFFEMATMVLIYPVIGVVAWVLITRIRENTRRLEGALGELRDTQDRLVDEEKHAAIGRLASAMAHEIRNPVAMIVSALEGESREGAGAGASEYREIAAREAARLERLTTDFLAYARSKAPDWGVVPVASMLDYIARLTAARANVGEVRISVRCDEALEAWMDEFLLHQALLNLTLNAVEHTPAKGGIVLGAERQGNNMCIYVENSGSAIPPETAGRLFEPFFTTRPTGTGLGLAISQRIAERHGGTLTLSRNEDAAVRFTLSIPQDASARQEAPAP
jgi:signal transduction histidine kinase